MKTLLIIGLLTFNFANASIYEFQKGDNAVSFLAKGRPALISIKGTGTDIKGELSLVAQKLNADIRFSLDALDTGIELRDEHLKKNYLETHKFPEARLQIKDSPALIIGESASFKGLLTLHGVEREVTGNAKLTESKVEAEFMVKLSDFKIEIPSFQGITVAESVTIMVNAPVVKKD